MAKELTPAQKKAKAAKDKARRDKSKKTASASKGTVKKGAKAAPEQSDDATRKLIGAQSVLSLAKSVDVLMERSSAAGGEAGQLISEAVKKKGLNAAAFRIAHRLRRIGLRDPNKLLVMLEDLEHYKACLQLEKLAGAGLFEPRAGAQEEDVEPESEPETEPSEEASEPADPSGGNIHHIGRGKQSAA